jgi:hypothetical protein
MDEGSGGSGSVWPVVLERFERHAPASVMGRLALEHALPAGWVDEVFEAHRQRQYSRELLFSTVVELTTLVSLGLRPSLHAAARQMPALPVSLASLYDKVNHTEPAILRALVRGSAERLVPVMEAMGTCSSLPGWQLRVLDGNHLAASEKRLKPLRGFRGAALPEQSVVVYDPDLGLVTDLMAEEDAHASERVAAVPLLGSARPGELWIAAKSRSDLRGTGISARARCCKPCKRPGPVSSCANTAVTLAWPDKGGGKRAAAPTLGRSASRRSRSRTSKHLCGASRSRWIRPPRTARPRSGCGATCRAKSMPGGSPSSTARAGASKPCSGAWKAC